mgnify:FL=1
MTGDLSLLHITTNNYFSEKIISGAYFSSITNLDAKTNGTDDQAKPVENDLIMQHMTFVHESYRETKINEMLEVSQVVESARIQNKIRYHSLEAVNSRSYYDSHQFNCLVKRVKDKVIIISVSVCFTSDGSSGTMERRGNRKAIDQSEA